MRVGIVSVLVVVVVIGGLLALQRRLIYLPSQQVPALPVWVSEVTAATEDDLRLRGWLVRDAVDQPLVLVLHGNGGNAAGRLPLAEALRSRGIATLLAEYRGYGGNPGSPTEEGLASDARAWREWARAAHDGPVTLYGESIGAAVATRSAVEDPPAALVLRSPFTSLADVARANVPLPPLGPLLLDTHEIAGLVGGVAAPVLVVLGTDDGIVPPAQSRAVHRAAGEGEGEGAMLVEVEGADHNDLALLAGDQLLDAVAALVATVD